ncbi:RNA polymerase sigma factor [Niastella sp. OAS944]|uniref:RNA polymerase sigma factor n=1 Tax=Niastella sp. OAS944 TaxID=2664089 RepID=UPI00346AEA54|nr:RNA polymerase sigma factor (sigma-70 family) [Chitinophagaceae bacterium OAS944]
MEKAQLVEWRGQHEKIDEGQFVKLVDRHQKIIGRICRIYRDSIDDRVNLFHEIVFQLWISAPVLNKKARFSLGVYQIALSTCITSCDKKKSNSENTTNLSKGKRIQQGAADDKEKLISALMQLNYDDKAMIALYLEDLKYPEIAEITGVAETIVGVKLNRIKKQIQQLLCKSLEQYPIKSIWQSIDTIPVYNADIKVMLSDRSHPTLKRLNKRLIIETVAFTIFLFLYYVFFSINPKPLFLEILLAGTLFFSILNNFIPYRLLKKTVRGNDIKSTLQYYLFKIRSHTAFFVIGRLMVIASLFLFTTFVTTNNPVQFAIIAFMILLVIIQIVLFSRYWTKRFKQLKYTISHLRRQREFIKK